MEIVASVNLAAAARALFQTITWQDALDLVIVAFLIYELLIHIRGTQAVQLLMGLLLVGLIGLVAVILNLPVLKFIFVNGGQLILVFLIVLFQPELRRALDQMGRLGRFRAGLLAPNTADLSRTVDEVVSASVRLSEGSIGALIVLQGDIGLEEIAATGVRLDAILSAEVLVTVFTYKAPLHDGAALVRSGRLVAAGCVLPLAEQTGSAGRVGTRHRAAMGLCQATDAGVVVVSEETGAISWAQGGEMTKGLTPEMLRNQLGAFFKLPLYERHRLTLRRSSRGSRKPGRTPAAHR